MSTVRGRRPAFERADAPLSHTLEGDQMNTDRKIILVLATLLLGMGVGTLSNPAQAQEIGLKVEHLSDSELPGAIIDGLAGKGGSHNRVTALDIEVCPVTGRVYVAAAWNKGRITLSWMSLDETVIGHKLLPNSVGDTYTEVGDLPSIDD